MKIWQLSSVVIGVGVLVGVSCWGAETVVEAWWSSPAPQSLGPQSASVNPADGTCRVADTNGRQIVELGPVASPVADFSANPTSGPPPLRVNFTDASTNSPTSWSWDFGDGGTSTAQNPIHFYGTAGSYTVALTAANTGGSNTCTKSNYISASPAAGFSASPTSGTAPLSVAFADHSFGAPTSWSWDFGDGGSDTVQSPSHAYQTAGRYPVALTVTNLSGTSTASLLSCISVYPQHTLTVSAASSQFTSSSGATVNLTATAVDTEGHTIASWSWSDGGKGGRVLRSHLPEPDLHGSEYCDRQCAGHPADGDRDL